MKGFMNMGNTCYMNAGLQMLMQNEDLCNLIIKYADKSLILEQLAIYIFEYYNPKIAKAIKPIEIKNILQKKYDIFNGFEQHDTSEFIISFLNIINDEIKKYNKNDGIEQLFNIQFNINISCKASNCLQSNNIKENNIFLILDIKPDFNNLNDAYDDFKLTTLLDNDNKYYCSNCKLKQIAAKKQKVKYWSPNLIILLKRFQQDSKRIIKNTQKIDVPLVWKHNYYLYGGIIHHGNINGGHYFYIGKQNNKWFIFNDSQVSEVVSKEQLKKILSDTYLLYYKKL
jgi:ubiquitin C-terminal hydrolase